MRKEGVVPLSPLPYRTVNIFKKTSFRPKRYVRRVLQYSLRIFQSKISSLPPLGPSHLQLSPHCTLAALTSPWFPGSAKRIPTPERCTSCSPCLEHSSSQCDTLSHFPKVPTQISPSQGPSRMTVWQITYTSSTFPTRHIWRLFNFCLSPHEL